MKNKLLINLTRLMAGLELEWGRLIAAYLNGRQGREMTMPLITPHSGYSDRHNRMPVGHVEGRSLHTLSP